MAWNRMGANPITMILGRWTVTPGGRSIPEGGLAYYMSPPRGLGEVFRDPIHAFIYIAFVLGSCAILSYSWLSVSGSSPRDVVKTLQKKELCFRSTRKSTMIKPLNRY